MSAKPSPPGAVARPRHADAAAANEATRRRRLREDARRPLSVNLAETIALSHELLKLAGSARQS